MAPSRSLAAFLSAPLRMPPRTSSRASRAFERVFSTALTSLAGTRPTSAPSAVATTTTGEPAGGGEDDRGGAAGGLESFTESWVVGRHEGNRHAAFARLRQGARRLQGG